MIEIGKAYRACIPNVGRVLKVHVVAIVDENMVVYKWYGKYKQWWHYEVHEIVQLEWRIEMAEERS